MKSSKITIGVLSDTHLKENGKLPIKVWKEFEGVSAILHAGDILNQNILEELECLAPTYAVQGNCDGFALSYLPTSRTIKIDNIKIGMTHGHLGYGRTTLDKVYNMFKNESLDILIFGHSHIPLIERREDVLLFNPGSPTDKRQELNYSFGIITINDGAIETSHHYF